MSGIARLCAGVLLLAAAPALSQAPQQRPIVVSADAPFAHANSGLTLPAALAGLPRRHVLENEAPQLDVAATYRRDHADELTVYVYRVTSGAVPVWFDRARWAIESRPQFGTLTLAAPPAAIAPPGRSVASGLIASWSLVGSDYKGTGVAMLPLDDWLVKLRYSSKTQDGAAVADMLRRAIGGLAWPAAATDAAAAVPVADCPNALSFKGSAKAMQGGGSDTVFGALLAAIPRSRLKTVGPPPVWCREPVRLAAAGVYRADAAVNAYLIALSDAGRGVWVGPSVAPQLDKTAKPSWTVDLILPGRTLNYPPQDRLPKPDRTLELLKDGAVSSVTTWGDKPQISVNVSPSSLK